MAAAPLPVAVLRTGVANLASVLAGLRRAGAAPFVTVDPADVERAPAVVLPGVGAFGAGMRALTEHGLVEPLRARAAAGRPLLSVCLGLQLLGAESAETPGVAGLGIVEAKASRFSGKVKVPQLGWNRVTPTPGMRFLRPGFAYFANSYRLDRPPAGWLAASADHGGVFVAAMEKGALLACQFHPELSGPWGNELLVRWLARAAEETT
ncbi:MAG: imidazole glycerol phosphate synthase subunit HisH [Deltaproteobacteria bacterium]|nr:imidazole glycerol phosphate synthase subunit HisH [Deltaproteobacteria bacterium]